MDSYQSFLDEAGVKNPWSDYPDTYQYFAYKAGQSFGPFETREEAKKVSVNIEKIKLENPAKEAAIKEFVRLGLVGRESFLKALREEHLEVSDGVYDICYEEAYDRGHSAGYDEVAAHLPDYIYLAKRIIEAANKK